MANSTRSIKIGIIGGSGLDNPDILQNREEKYVETPYGKPSDALILGTINQIPCVLLARHGRQHAIYPTNINYRANIYSLKQEGCTHVLVTTACGSLQEHIHPGDLVVLDQFVDRTKKREQTFYDGQHDCCRGVLHIPMGEPFCPHLRQVLIEVCKEMGIQFHATGTVVTIEGPRFSTRAESREFRSMGAHVINMTSVPEVPLAKELGLSYAAIALPTDYDCWKENTESVNVELVLENFKKVSATALEILKKAVTKIGAMDWADVMQKNEDTVRQAIM